MMRVDHVGLMVVAALLAACSSSTESDLRGWMAEQKNQTRPKVSAIAEPKQFKSH